MTLKLPWFVKSNLKRLSHYRYILSIIRYDGIVAAESPAKSVAWLTPVFGGPEKNTIWIRLSYTAIHYGSDRN